MCHISAVKNFAFPAKSRPKFTVGHQLVVVLTYLITVHEHDRQTARQTRLLIYYGIRLHRALKTTTRISFFKLDLIFYTCYDCGLGSIGPPVATV